MSVVSLRELLTAQSEFLKQALWTSNIIYPYTHLCILHLTGQKSPSRGCVAAFFQLKIWPVSRQHTFAFAIFSFGFMPSDPAVIGDDVITMPAFSYLFPLCIHFSYCSGRINGTGRQLLQVTSGGFLHHPIVESVFSNIFFQLAVFSHLSF